MTTSLPDNETVRSGAVKVIAEARRVRLRDRVVPCLVSSPTVLGGR